MEELASNNYQWPLDRSMLKRAAGVIDLDPITNFAAQMETLSKELGKLNVNSIRFNIVCDLCAGNHHLSKCLQGNYFILSSSKRFHMWEISTGKIIHITTFTISIGGAIQIFLRLTIKGLPAFHLMPITQEQAIPRGDITNHDAKIISTYAKVRAKHAKDGLIHAKD